MASIEALPAAALDRTKAAGEWLAEHGLLVAGVALCAAVVTARLPALVSQDTWYTLVAGREVVRSGPPTRDALTFWTAGRPWVDVQWLAQAAAYALFRLGGLPLLALAHAALLTLAVGLAVACARRRSGSVATALALLAAAYPLVVVPWYVRAQSFAYPLFVLVLGLLLEDVRSPSRRVLWSLPLLVLWANVHGSAALGAGLVFLRAVTLLGRSHRRPVAAALALGAVATLVATPWGLATVGYYRHTLLNPSFRRLVTEWQPLELSAATAPVLVLAGLAFFLLGRSHHRYSVFEGLMLLLVSAAALASFRNVVWLALASVPLLAPGWDDLVRPRQTPEWGRRARCAVALAGAAIAGTAVGVTVSRPDEGLSPSFPQRAAQVVARVASSHPSLRIFAHERYADWLLLLRPELRGRIAFDIRFELLTGDELESIARWRSLSRGWEEVSAGAGVIVLDRSERDAERALLAHPGVRVLFRDPSLTVLGRDPRQEGRVE